MSETTPAPAITNVPGYTHAQIKRVVTGVMLCILLAALDQTVVIPAVPAIAGELNAFGHLSWIVSAYLLTSTAATPIIGKLSDSYGRRALLIPSLVLFIVASVLCALCTKLPQLIAARALQGLGGAGLMAMAQAAVADVVSPRERGRYQGYMAGMWGIASIAGPIVGGYVTDHLSWRYIFWINVPLGLLALFLCDRALRLLPVRGARLPIDFAGALILVCAITAWLLALTWGGTELPWASPPILGLAALGALLLALLIWQERRAADPVLPPRLFGKSTFLRGVTIAFCTSGALLGATFLLPLYHQLLHGAAAGGSGLLVMPFLFATVIGAFSGGQVARRLGRTKAIVVSGLCLGLVGFAALAALPVTVAGFPSLVCSFALGLGLGATLPAVLILVQNTAPNADVGTATGSLLFLRSMGGAIGTTMVGALLVLGFQSALSAAGLSGIELGSFREHLTTLPASGRMAALGALSSGFRIAFMACAGLLFVGLIVALGMRDEVLRSGPIPNDQGR